MRESLRHRGGLDDLEDPDEGFESILDDDEILDPDEIELEETEREKGKNPRK